MTPQHPAAPEGESEVGGWVEVLLSAHHWGDDTAMVGRVAMQCGCGRKDSDAASRIYSLRARHDQHRAEVIATAARGRVRVVKGERDAAREKAEWWERTCTYWNEQATEAQRFRDLNLARAESAEAALAAEKEAHAALRGRVEALADEWCKSTTWDGRIEPVGRAYGRALRDRLLAGGGA